MTNRDQVNKKTSVKDAEKHAKFLAIAYAGLVLRGHDTERSIPDPILREVWRHGKKCLRSMK